MSVLYLKSFLSHLFPVQNVFNFSTFNLMEGFLVHDGDRKNVYTFSVLSISMLPVSPSCSSPF